MHSMFFSGYGYELWRLSSGRDRGRYRMCEQDARRELLSVVSPEAADYVLGSFSFALGLTCSWQGYSELNGRYEHLLSSWSMTDPGTRKEESKTWRRYLFMSKVTDVLMFIMLDGLTGLLFVLLGLYAFSTFMCKLS